MYPSKSDIRHGLDIGELDTDTIRMC